MGLKNFQVAPHDKTLSLIFLYFALNCLFRRNLAIIASHQVAMERPA